MKERIREVARHLAGRECAYDIGANVGTCALELAPIFDKVIAFEPVRANFEKLQVNMQLYPNVKCVNAGVSSRSFHAWFDTAGKSISCKIGDPADPGGKRGEWCSLVKIDAFHSHISRCDFIKIDVEGHEFQALEGAALTIQNRKPVIMIEEKFDPEFRASRLLEQWGYRQVWKKKHDRVFVWKN